MHKPFVIDSYKLVDTNFVIPGENEDRCDTAGFIDIETRMEKLLQAGYIAQFQQSEFDSLEERELYMSDEYRITSDMDLEDIQEVLRAREERRMQILKEHEAQAQQKAEATSDEKKSASKKEEEHNTSS